MEFEDILKEVGDWGRFQKLLLMCFGLSIAMVTAFPGMALIFMVIVPDHNCHIPEAINMTYKELNNFDHFAENSSCTMFVDSSKVMNDSFVNYTSETSCIYGWHYDKTYFDSTAATKWDMVCKSSHFPSLILTLQNVGSLIGTPIYGALADRFGRKVLCFSMLLLSSVTDLISVFVDSLLLFIILRTINGSVLPTMFILPYIHISELVSPNKRVWVNGVINLGWTIGVCLLPLVAYLVRSWVVLGIFSSVITALILLYWKIVPGSASWLVSQEKYEDATTVMMLIKDSNKKPSNKADLELKLKELGEKIKRNKEEEKKRDLSFITKFPRLRKHFFILTFSWMSNAVSYYGLTYNVVNLDGNVFLNFFLLSLVECPGYILFWVMMEKLGRRWSGSIGFLGISLCCLLPLTGLEHIDLISSTIGKLIASGIYMVPNQQACELYPTVVRSVGVGIGRSIATVAILFTPFLSYLSIYGKSIPFVVISMICFVAAILTSFLPETLNKNLPQTLSDAESFGKDQEYFSFNV